VVIDSSALLAILLEEPEGERFFQAVKNAAIRLISVVTALEAAMVMEGRYGEEAGDDVDMFLYDFEVQIVPLEPHHYEIARVAWRKYGKGRHPAALNLGDCCAYALSKATGEPLLYKGDDFGKTDVTAVEV
jgi:ribonuclease VapC